MGGSFIYLLGTSQGRGAARKRACPRWDYDASVRVDKDAKQRGVGQG